MSATINRKLNIVFAMRENKIWVHSMPISRAVYKAYFLPMSRAYEVIHGNNMHMTGPRNAALTLEKVSRDTGVWDGPDGIENGLMTEIRRLTNILTPVAGNNGWEMLPYQSAIMSNYLDEEDIDEIDEFT